MKIKLIIFDLDGTLLYTLEDLKNSVNFALGQIGLQERTLDEIRNFVGNGIYKLIERAVGNNKDKIEECLNLFKEHYKTANSNTHPYNGIVEVLKTLKGEGIKIAILSNKSDFLVKNIVKTYFEGLYDFTMGETPDFPIKPNPKSTLFIIEKFKAEKEQTLFIGDSEVDIQTAKNAEINCLSASWGYKSEEFLMKSEAKIILKKPEEILNYV